MSIVKKEYVLDQITRMQLPYYIVKDGNTVLDVQDDDITPEESAEQLNNMLEALDDGIITILLSDKSSSDKARGGRLRNFSYKVRVRSNGSIHGQNTNVQTIPNNSELARLHEKVRTLELQLQQKQHEFDLYKLERKFDESKEKSVFDHPMAQTAIAGLLQMWNKSGIVSTDGTPPINGHEHDVHIEQANNVVRLKEATKKLMKLDPNFIDNLCKLAELAEQKPEMYATALNVLKSM